jgi:hypothetical protein
MIVVALIIILTLLLAPSILPFLIPEDGTEIGIQTE